MIARPGQVYTPWFEYDNRWPWGRGEIKVVSWVADEPLLPGTVVQSVVPGRIRAARDATKIVGIVVYDPRRHSPAVVYQPFDVVPVLRQGKAFAQYLPPPDGSSPPVLGTPTWGADGVPTLGAANSVPWMAFTIATKDFFLQSSDGSPQADVPFPQPPPPPGIANTTFGSGVCLIEVNR